MPEINNLNFDKDKSQGAYCPFIKDPHPDCYCLEINNSKINLVMRFCSKDYEQCDIYKTVFQKSV